MNVHEFRVSSIWTEGVVQVLTDDLGRYGRLVRRDDYAALFRNLLANDDDLVTIPWPRSAGEKYPEHNHFWNGYVLNDLRKRPRSDPGERAWDAVVPLRRSMALAHIDHADRTYIEAWYHPHGVAVAVTARFNGTFDAATMKRTANAFLSGPLDVTWTGDPAAEKLTLIKLALSALDKLRTEAFGKVEHGNRSDPMRVVTITKASRDPAEDDAAQAPFLAAAISIAGGSSTTTTAPDRDVYVVPNGRAIVNWDQALSTEKNVHRLGCFHRNVTVATMQTASILVAADLLTVVSDDAQGVVPVRVEPFARRVAGLIGRINRGPASAPDPSVAGDKIYSAPFLRAQIAEANALGRLNTLRDRLQMTPLT